MKATLPFLFALFTAISYGQHKPQNTNNAGTVPAISKSGPKIRINGGSFFASLESQNVSVVSIQNDLNNWLGLSQDHTFKEVSNKKDNLGISHQNFQQFYKNIPVDGSSVMLHSKNGIATSMNGKIIAVEGFEINPVITKPEAKTIALKNLNATKLLHEYPVDLVLMKITKDQKQQTKLAFKVRIDASDPIQMTHVFVDAISGEVLQKINLIAQIDEPGTGQTLYRGQKSITVDSHQGAFRLRESARNIETYDAASATFSDVDGFQNFSDFTSPTSDWLTINPALDVHWGMEKTYDFFLNNFNRHSYDDLGSPIKNFVDGTMAIANTQNNAYALPPPYNVMVYGLGDGIQFTPLVGLDVEGHEFTHMVVQFNGNGGLTYFGESGALNESFADIFGTAIEFSADANGNWTIGEDMVVQSPFYLRSMSDPNSGSTQQPDSYNGTFWKSTSSNFDSGGVHYNSGVQNYWFYLLTEGGTGTNDFGYNFNVPAIGITTALEIAYRNLTTYLPNDATYADARDGSLLAAADLFGASSPEYLAVAEAWLAVNVEGNPTPLCDVITFLTDASGTFSDNSGNSDYLVYTECKWLIAPEGAQQITLDFTTFQTEEDYDFVKIYDGPNQNAPLLGSFSGHNLPPTISTSMGVGAMFIKFTSDDSINDTGWTADYTTLGIPTCTGTTTFTAVSATFDDGSGNGLYGNNQHCDWVIAPPCATFISLSFSEFETESQNDFVLVFDDIEGTHLIATLSGANLPGAVISAIGEMSIRFTTGFSNVMPGFTAAYTSDGNANGNANMILNDSDFGTITDGSEGSNYCNGQNSTWLIQPPQATSVTLQCSEFDIEAAIGNVFTDAFEIYDGTSDADTLLGRFAGNDLPPNITSSGGSMFIKFYSNATISGQGFAATYTSTQASSCSDAIFTNESGSFSDGSTNGNYANNSSCSWLIQPEDANSVTLSFTAFDTESGYDTVTVYDGIDATASVLGIFSGNPLPAEITSTGGNMFVTFNTNTTQRGDGWAASYTSTILGIQENHSGISMHIFPNPNNGKFTITSTLNAELTVSVVDMLGKTILPKHNIKNGNNDIDASQLSSGVYLLHFESDGNYYTEKLIIR
ncbi:CUB domain-containing protein [Flavobacterium pallidum]|uniref:CUB domain-containing protein n=1 Tax=Flavobacterium pallidum TaxID=2172098 RepID=A0A2S1SJC3_9FLAO|nr:CUB domain-containing protein [Flavobacterium pallidum]AWI26510.1 hypothetical protein HYN49_11705 [Flavobacterium pallidum]